MRRVIVESPYAGDVDANVAYARRCVADCLERGEAPLASHLLYTQEGILRDEVPEERRRGIEAGLAWGDVADASVFYVDRGVSRGMREGARRALAAGRPIEIRLLGVREPMPRADRHVYVAALLTPRCISCDGDLPTEYAGDGRCEACGGENRIRDLVGEGADGDR